MTKDDYKEAIIHLYIKHIDGLSSMDFFEELYQIIKSRLESDQDEAFQGLIKAIIQKEK